LAEAGYTRGADGVYASPTGGRLGWQAATNGSSQNESELSILGSGWRQAGFDVQEYVSPPAQAQDGQIRASFPGIFTFNTPLGETTLASENSTGIPRPENRWVGNNRGGYRNAEFDRLSEAFTTSLDHPDRVSLIGQMVRIWSDELPAIPLFFSLSPAPYVAALTGPKVAAPGAANSWDVYTWELH
jgi:peptide/nickel transport system substrate-binding protein